MVVLISKNKIILSLILCSSAGHPFLDLLSLEAEPPPEAGQQLKCFPLGCGDSPASVTPAQVSCLRQEVFLKGQVKSKCPLTALWDLIVCLTEALLSSFSKLRLWVFFFSFRSHSLFAAQQKPEPKCRAPCRRCTLDTRGCRSRTPTQ